MVAAAAASLFVATAARAEYPGHNGSLAYELFSYGDTEGGPPFTLSDAIIVGHQTIASCTNNGPNGQLQCDFGAPSFSPDGQTVVFSREVAAAGTSAAYQPTAGRLMLTAADGTNPQMLPRLTADDEQPAFLPSGSALVFTGRTAAGSNPNLYSVNTDGTGLKQLTTAGGSQPAPCANGAVAYIEKDRLYLRNRNGSTRRLTRIASWAPSCAPNSRTIAFLHAGQLYVIGSKGTQLRRVSKASGYGPGGVDSGSSAYADTFSPDGTRIAMMVGYDVLTQNGSEEALVRVGLRGHRVGSTMVIASSSFSGDSGQTDSQDVAGLAWRPSSY